ncbi:MAG TPA: TonB-dependent receptor plug domain-containing protein, partial [Chitinophagaceae bacterium]|nr:TonB-dependent receptor plug domain-containing protein [Chitinophagaceae bacterium]
MLAKLTSPRVLVFALFLCAAIPSFAQKKVEGKVTGPDGKPVFGATVTAKGTNVSTTTSTDGSYSITLPANSSVLEITYVGNQSVELNVSNRTTADVTMKFQAANLDEVVVIGYGTAKRKDLTGSVSSVSAATIEKLPVASATQALQGRASGVQIINNDGAPGGNVTVLIRGVGSLAPGGNGPLYVVDGYPTTGGINNINPNDIATIDVLKDASASAVYGIRAANGVVIITTKRGLKNRVQVSLDMYASVQNKPKQYDLLNAQEFATL